MMRYLSLLLITASSAAAVEQTLLVAPDGLDTNDGSIDAPVATLTRARNILRERKAAGTLNGPTTVYVAAGVYWLDEPLEMTPEDSGTREAPITYAARPGERVVVSGGRRITGWHATGNAGQDSVLHLDRRDALQHGRCFLRMP